MIIGTAGHIDHGKTSLVARLTGSPGDRLAEEKRRGITIELGYSFLPVTEHLRIGFVDVPGHERLLHNMLAGVTGIAHGLLVVAADDGPMPQTLEHLSALSLLAVPALTVALTKIDRVTPDREREVRHLVAEMLQAHGYGDTPVFAVSNLTGEGVQALSEHLRATARRQSPLAQAPDASRGFRLAIDRAFKLAGIGTVVTGTIHAGSVAVDETVRLLPWGTPLRVRSLHAQQQEVERAYAGQRCAINVTGESLQRRAPERGDWLGADWLHAGTQRLDARIKVIESANRSIKTWMPGHLHHGALDLNCRLVPLSADELPPGSTGWVQIVTERALHALRGDRFVLRDASGSVTLAGGLVIDPIGPERGRRSAERLATLAALEHPVLRSRVEQTLRAQVTALDVRTAAACWNERDGLDLIESPDLVRSSGRLWQATRWVTWRNRLVSGLDQFHLEHADEPGCERARFRRLCAPQLDPSSYEALLESLLASAQICSTGGWLHRPGHRIELSADEETFREQAMRQLTEAGVHPPWVRDLAALMRRDEAQVRTYLLRLMRNGEVQQVVRDWFFPNATLEVLKAVAIRLQRDEDAVSAARFRDESGLSRKRAIQVLEYFDRIGVSRRVRDSHRIREA